MPATCLWTLARAGGGLSWAFRHIPCALSCSPCEAPVTVASRRGWAQGCASRTCEGGAGGKGPPWALPDRSSIHSATCPAGTRACPPGMAAAANAALSFQSGLPLSRSRAVSVGTERYGWSGSSRARGGPVPPAQPADVGGLFSAQQLVSLRGRFALHPCSTRDDKGVTGFLSAQGLSGPPPPGDVPSIREASAMHGQPSPARLRDRHMALSLGPGRAAVTGTRPVPHVAPARPRERVPGQVSTSVLHDGPAEGNRAHMESLSDGAGRARGSGDQTTLHTCDVGCAPPPAASG